MFQKNPYAIIGTTPPIFLPRGREIVAVRSGQDYFFVQIYGAQVAFNGSIWERVKNLIVATKVSINHPLLGQEDMRGIQRTREVRREHAEQLGLCPNLIGLMPAIMPDISISIEFILDKENSLRSLSGLINSDSFLAAVSLAPGASMVAKTISGLAGKVIETFVPAEERQPILQFGGKFNLADEGLKDGYYIILGTRDDRNPLPNPLPRFQVKDGLLLANNEIITQLSYVVIDVHRTAVRTRFCNDNAVWEVKLREAEDEASRFANDPMADDKDRKSAWEKCRNLIKEAQTLLRSDINFHRHEAENIIKTSFVKCAKDLNINTDNRSSGGIVKASRGNWSPDMRTERLSMGISPEENLGAMLASYAEQTAEVQRMLESAGMISSI